MDTVTEFIDTHLKHMQRQSLAWNLLLLSIGIQAVLAALAPLAAVRAWRKRGYSDPDTPIPYLMGLFGTAMWLRYSMLMSDYQACLLFSYNICTTTFFITVMIIYRKRATRRHLNRLVFGVVALIVSLLVIGQCALSPSMRTHMFGTIAGSLQFSGAFACGCFIVGGRLVYAALKKGRLDFLPFFPCAFALNIELHAIVYAYGMNDFYIFFSNFIFFFMDGILFTLFFILPTEPLEDHSEAEEQTKLTKEKDSDDDGDHRETKVYDVKKQPPLAAPANSSIKKLECAVV